MSNFIYGCCLIVLLVLNMCGCAMISNQARNTSVAELYADTEQASVTAIPDEQHPLKLPHPGLSYHSDSAELRINHLENRRHGTSSADDHFYNTDRKPTRQGSINNIDSEPPVKANTPWSRLQLKLNHRWLLDADLSNMGSMPYENSHGFMPTPRLSYEFGSLKLVSRYIPHIQDYNASAVTAIYLSIMF